jgi:hypothetical protein
MMKARSSRTCWPPPPGLPVTAQPLRVADQASAT